MKRTSTQILADSTSAMVQDHDVTDTLSTLLKDCGEGLSAAAVGLLIRSESGQIELLSSTSHAMAELELFQIQQATGPCIDAISSDIAISVVGSADILARWPGVGRAIIEAGYQSVNASPLRWRGRTLGALNAFFVDPAPRTKEQVLLAQTLADVATLVIVQAVDLSVGDVGDRILAALDGRAIIEQAKGVIAFDQSLDMASAYDLLVTTASRKGTSLSATAEGIITAVQHRPLPI